MVAAAGPGARRGAAEAGRPHGTRRRDPRPAGQRGRGQADHGVPYGRRTGRDRVDPLVRRGRRQGLRPHRAQRARRSRSHESRTGRGRRGDPAVELPARHDRMEGRTGPGRRQLSAGQARRGDPALSPAPGRTRSRGRPARRGAHGTAGVRSGNRCGPCPSPPHRGAVLHRVHRDRPPHPQGRRREQLQARLAGDGRQEPPGADGRRALLRRRAHRQHDRGRLPDHGAELYGRLPGSGSPQYRRGGAGAVHGRGGTARHRRSGRPAHADGAAHQPRRLRPAGASRGVRPGRRSPDPHRGTAPRAAAARRLLPAHRDHPSP